MENKLENRKDTKKQLSFAVTVTIAVIVAVFSVFIACCVSPYTQEVGENIDLSHNKPFLSGVCKVIADTSIIDTEKIGTYPINVRVLGFLKLPSKLMVRDTTPPEITVRELTVPKGAEPLPEDFVVKTADKTALRLEFRWAPITDSNGTAQISAIDEGGNVTTVSVPYKVSDTLSVISVEKGTPTEDIAELVNEQLGKEISTDIPDEDYLGEFHTVVESDGKNNLIVINIADTKAPEFNVISYDVLKGQTLSPLDFLSDVYDASEYTVEFITPPDFNKVARKQTVEILLEDEYGNSSIAKAELNVHNLSSTVISEAGLSAKSLGYMVSNMLGTDDPLPRIAEDFECKDLPVGTYPTELVGEYSVIPINVEIRDTIAPKVKLKPLTVLIGRKRDITDFVEEYTDASEVSLSFKYEPSTDKEGRHLVTVIAADEWGNTAEYTTVMKVTLDDTPPRFYGITKLTAYEGDTVSYRKGVSAIDDSDGKVGFSVDTSRVKTSVVGTYTVVYTATDRDGNTVSETTTLEILPITEEAAYARADEVLAGIIKEGMTDREKARAIYDWCRANIRYSTLTSHLMGHYERAAYSGFTKHYGNCYTYYAVASALLNRVGIENMEIHRNSTTNPHYWNLVNIDGSWYHLDTCPQPPPHNLEVFLLTDADVKAFTQNKVANYYNFNADDYPATP